MDKVSPLTRTTYGEAVIRGAKVLDELVPGWAHRVNLKRLHMADGSLCMLGQLFGNDVEMAIAKEMYPEKWQEMREESKTIQGYMIGLRWVRDWFHRATGERETSRRIEEANFLFRACGGASIECLWAEQVAKRVAADGKGE